MCIKTKKNFSLKDINDYLTILRNKIFLENKVYKAYYETEGKVIEFFYRMSSLIHGSPCCGFLFIVILFIVAAIIINIIIRQEFSIHHLVSCTNRVKKPKSLITERKKPKAHKIAQ